MDTNQNDTSLKKGEETGGRDTLSASKRVVVKLGTGILSREDGQLEMEQISRLSSEIASLGQEVVLVSSGAVGAGVEALGMEGRPKSTTKLQMAAAVGQVRLLKAYREEFSKYGVEIAQVLLTRDGLLDRRRYLNTRNTLLALIRAGVLPVVNQNDVVSTEGLCFGDNDYLAACVAAMVDADSLVILSSVEGLLDSEGKVVDLLSDLNESRALVDPQKKTGLGVGGMSAKLDACELAVKAGVNTLIASGREEEALGSIFRCEPRGTFIAASENAESRVKKKWIAFFPEAEGEVIIDSGAERALVEKQKSLLPVGVLGVRGDFDRGALIEVKNEAGLLLARGLSSRSSDGISQVKGMASDEISKLSVEEQGPYDDVINRDNLIILKDDN